MGQQTNFDSLLQNRMTDTDYIKYLESQILEISANINEFLKAMDEAHFSKASAAEATMKKAYADSAPLLINTIMTKVGG